MNYYKFNTTVLNAILIVSFALLTMNQARAATCWQWEFVDPQGLEIVRLAGRAVISDSTRLPTQLDLAEKENIQPALISVKIAGRPRRDDWLSGTLKIVGSDDPPIPVKGRWHVAYPPSGLSKIWLSNDRVGVYLLLEQQNVSSCNAVLGP